MEICPKCKKKIEPTDHFSLDYRDISQIQCRCGYRGLPVRFVKEED